MRLGKQRQQQLRDLCYRVTRQLNKRLAGNALELQDKKEIGEALALCEGFLHLLDKDTATELEQLKLNFNDTQ